jgi:formylglycine-generating enzyme required for sulfatase activity
MSKPRAERVGRVFNDLARADHGFSGSKPWSGFDLPPTRLDRDLGLADHPGVRPEPHLIPLALPLLLATALSGCEPAGARPPRAETCAAAGCSFGGPALGCVCDRLASLNLPPRSLAPSSAWIPIPGGQLQMGSATGRYDERPVHRVTVAGFRMSRTEVTVAQYRQCVIARACAPANTGDKCNWGLPDREDHPVNCVDWSQAQVYARWVGARLPTEAEWEHAARGGDSQRAYPWGNEAPTCARAVMKDGRTGCGSGRTWPVCSKPAGSSLHGLCDMAGNVWEWVQDTYHTSYAGAPTDGRAWEDSAGTLRVYRGGCWGHEATLQRSACRVGQPPTSRTDGLGFRLVRALD